MSDAGVRVIGPIVFAPGAAPLSRSRNAFGSPRPEIAETEGI
jgi:hypothetical protein